MSGKSNDAYTQKIRPPSDHYAPGANWDADIGRGTLLDILDHAVKTYPKNTYINFLGKNITYRQFGELVDKAAAGLQQRGIKPGMRVGLYMPNTAFYPIMMFAALKAGATVVNFSPLYTQHELTAQAKDSGTDTMIALDLKAYGDATNNVRSLLNEGTVKQIVVCQMADMLPFVKSAAFSLLKRKDVFTPDYNDHRVTTFGGLTDHYIKPAPVVANPDDPAVLQYTGGTTGVPKGAVLTHFNLYANVKQIEEMYGARPGRPDDPTIMHPGKEKFLLSIPFFHIFGLTVGMINAMNIGAQINILPNPRDMKATMKAIHKEKPTIFPAVPRMLQGIMAQMDLGKYNLTSIRTVISGGAALPPDVKTAFERAVKCKVFQGYGLSETSPVATAAPPGGIDIATSVGQPFAQTEIRISDPADPGKSMPADQSGEICIRGPQVMKGYWNKADETRSVMTDDGFFRTGDIGHVDEKGYLYITDRLKRMLAINGFKVYPNMVESAMYKHPNVAECVVIGVNKGTIKESVKAFVRYKDNAQPLNDAQWADFLSDKLHRMEIPRYFETRTEELPKTTVGKPDWKKLEDEEARMAAAQSPKPPQP